jgi:hypothetical protein
MLYVLAVLATYRLTRLVTADKITERFRVAVDSRNKTLGYLVTCDWCLSIWVAPWPALCIMAWPTNRGVLFALTALSLSAITGLLSLVEARLDT